MSYSSWRCRLLNRIRPVFSQPHHVSETMSMPYRPPMRYIMIERQYFQSAWTYPQIPREIWCQSVGWQHCRLLHGRDISLQNQGKNTRLVPKDEFFETDTVYMDEISSEQSIEKPEYNDEFVDEQRFRKHGSSRGFSRIQQYKKETASEFEHQGDKVLTMEESIRSLLDRSDVLESQKSWSKKILEKASQVQREETNRRERYAHASIYERDVNRSDDEDSDGDESDGGESEDFEDSDDEDDDEDTDEDELEDMSDYRLRRERPRRHGGMFEGQRDLDFDLDENVDFLRRPRPVTNRPKRDSKVDTNLLYLEKVRELQKVASDTTFETELFKDLCDSSSNPAFKSMLTMARGRQRKSPLAPFFLDAKENLKRMSEQVKKTKQRAAITTATGQMHADS